MARHRHLPIWKSAFDLVVHLENAVRRFPRYHKYALGQELRQCARRLCRLVAQANDARDAMRVLIEVGNRWLWPQRGVASWSGTTRHYPGLGPCVAFRPDDVPGLRRRWKRQGVAHVLVAQDGHYRSGFKRRVLRLAWQPQPCWPTVSPSEHLSEVLSETLSFDSVRGLA